MNETQLRTIEQIEQFLSASAPIEFSTAGDDAERCAHISRALKRFDYPGYSKRERAGGERKCQRGAQAHRLRAYSAALCPVGVTAFYQDTFKPWLNLYCPCLFATKVVKLYKRVDVKTPLECLTQLCAKQLVRLKPDVTLPVLWAQARSQTDLAATLAMQQAKRNPFASFEKPKRRA